MADSIDKQIQDLEDQIKVLQEKKAKLLHPPIEYPKYIIDPKDSKKGRTVNSKEEEDAHNKAQAASDKADAKKDK